MIALLLAALLSDLIRLFGPRSWRDHIRSTNAKCDALRQRRSAQIDALQLAWLDRERDLIAAAFGEKYVKDIR